MDVYAAAASLKSWFRELPDPAFTFLLYDQILEAVGRINY
jgi:hypothetical protein